MTTNNKPQTTNIAPQVSVIVCSHNGARVLADCLRTLLASEGVVFEAIVVDNGSSDATPRIAKNDFPAARLVQSPSNLGFAGGNNLGIRAARGEILVLLNDDTEVPPDWLARLASTFDRDPQIGAAGCKLLYPGGKVIQHAGGIVYPNANTGHLGYGEEDQGQWDAPGEREYVTGAALGLRRAALTQIGLLDPSYFPIYFEELDLQARLTRAGWKIWYEPAAWLIHKESQSQGVASPRFIYRYTKNRIRYLAHQGFPKGKLAALRQEWPWLKDMRKQGRLGPVLRAYAYGLMHWPLWRLDRQGRKSVPRLG